MIDGIEILSQEIIKESTDLGLKIFLTGSIIALALGVLLEVFYFQDGHGVQIAVCGIGLCLVLGAVIDNVYQISTDKYEYKVIIDDNVSMTEFYKQYKIIDQDGKIFIIREKESVND